MWRPPRIDRQKSTCYEAGMKASRRRVLALVVAGAVAAGVWYNGRRPLRGTSERQLVVGGVTRAYLLHAGGAARPGRPLVLVLHGLGGSGTGIERRTSATFDRLADRDGAVVAYPQALGDPHRWNDGWPEAAPGAGAAQPDDLAFLAALVDALVAELGVDRRRVFAAGLSNGASMAYRLACERPDLVAAVAPVSGGMTPAVAGACAQGAPVAVIGMHGTEDPIAPLDGWVPGGIAAWARRDGCPERAASSRLEDADPVDETRTRVDLYEPCAAGTAVAFYTIEGGGHQWPGGEAPLGFRRRGRMSRDFDAGVVIWDFFQKHPRR
jgi:polyhydroxybutyrate depolymerase